MATPKWIAGQAVKSKPPRTLMDHMAGLRDRDVLVSIKPTAKPWLLPSPRDYPPASQCDPMRELKRFPSAKPSPCYSPLGADLMRDGLIELRYENQPPWRCLGFIQTEAGRRALKRMRE